MAVKGLIDFLKSSPSAFHAIDNLTKILKDNGFEKLNESGKWNLKKGGKYYVTRNLSSVIAFSVPEGNADSIRICASHSDSPVFKIKENAEIEVRGKYVQLNTERYGGMIFSTWLDRPLSVAGRVLVKGEKGVETRLVNIDKDMLIIPNVAIHMNRSVNDGFKYNPQTDLAPLYGDIRARGTFRKLISDAAALIPAYGAKTVNSYPPADWTIWSARMQRAWALWKPSLKTACRFWRYLTMRKSDLRRNRARIPRSLRMCSSAPSTLWAWMKRRSCARLRPA